MEQREALMYKMLELIFGDPAVIKRFLKHAADRKLIFPEMLRYTHLEDFQAAVRAEKHNSATRKNNSLVQKSFTCGFHDDAVAFGAWQVRPNTQKLEENEYLVRYSAGSARNQDPVNILTSAVIVCPQCFFASTAEQHFRVKSPTDANRTFESWNPNPRTIRAVLDGRPARTAVARKGHELHMPSRTPPDAYISYELANLSLASILQSSSERYGHYPLLIAENALACAQIAREVGETGREESFLREALAAIRQGESYGKGAVLYRSLFRIIRLALHFGDISLATKTASMLVQLKQRVLAERLKVSDGEKKMIMRYAGLALEARSDYLERQGQPVGELPELPESEVPNPTPASGTGNTSASGITPPLG